MDSIQDSLIVLELAESVRLKMENGKYHAALKVTLVILVSCWFLFANTSRIYRFWIAYNTNIWEMSLNIALQST